MSVRVAGSGVESEQRTKGWLERIATVTPTETRPFLLMLLLSFCLSSSTVFIETATNALFLAEFGAGQLPYVYIVSAVIISASGLLLTRLRSTLSLRWLLSGLAIFIFAITAGIWVGLSLIQLSWLIFASLLWYRFVKVGAELIFWSLANYIFNIQQAKRLFGPISTGEAVAQIIGYFLTPVISLYIGVINLMTLAVVLYGMAIVVIILVLRGYEGAVRTETKLGSGAYVRPTRRPTGYIALIFGLIAAGFLNYYLISFIFYSAADVQFSHSADELASFLGIIFGIAAILSLLVKISLSSRSLRRFGLLPNLILRPMIALSISLALWGTDFIPTSLVLVFGLVLLLSSFDSILLNGLYRPAMLLLYQPLAVNLRLTVLSLSESVIGPLSIGLVGVLLLVFGRTNMELNVILLAGNALIWIAIIISLGRLYPRVLQTSLQRRLLQGGSLTLNDSTSLAAVQERMNSPYPGEAIYALEILERAGASDLPQTIEKLLHHPHPAVRQEATDRAERMDLVAVLPTLRAMMVNDEPAVRASAVRTVAALEGDTVIEELHAFLLTQEPDMLRAGLTGLLRNGSVAARREAESWLARLVHGTQADRILAAHVVADGGDAAISHLIDPLIQDDAPSVRRTAILAVGRVAAHALSDEKLALLLALSADPDVGNAVQQAMSGCRGSVVKTLKQTFADPVSTPQQRVSMVQIAGRMQAVAAHTWLVTLVDHPSSAVRTAALTALLRQGKRMPTESIARIQVQLGKEVAEAGAVLSALTVFASAQGEERLLYEGLLALLAQIKQRLFQLLGLIHGSGVMVQIQENLELNSREKQANALEILDVTLKGETKSLVLPLLEPASAQEQLSRLRDLIAIPTFSAREVMDQMARGETEPFTPWLQASALYVIGRNRQANLYNAAFVALSSPYPLVAETACWTSAILSRHREGDRLAPTPSQEPAMLLTIEKALILRTVSLFETTPDEVLAQVARLVEEVHLIPGKTIFHKGDYGDSLYIIVEGKVRVHDGDNFFNYLSDRDLFGEMAVLDPEPRSASVTAETETHLLRLGREPLFELIDARPEVAHGIIRGLSGHLRNRLKDITDLRKQTGAVQDQRQDE